MVIPRSSLEAEGRQYSMNTPKNAWKTMVAVWCNISKMRIVEDIKRFESLLDAIIEADGAGISDNDLRNGH